MKFSTCICCGLIALSFISCKNNTRGNSSDNIKKREYSVQSVLWQQHAAEYKALCYQAFNIAKMRLDQKLNKADFEKTPVVVADLDETILDNSRFNAQLIFDNENYTSDKWGKWVKSRKATTVPGARDFLNYVESKGVEVYYISNRPEKLQDYTIKTLQKLELPYSDDNHLFLKTSTSAKEKRREKVTAGHVILFYLGDNLSDFSSVFDDKGAGERSKMVNGLKSRFGQKYIILPNPMYGDWESNGIYGGNHDLTETQKDSIRKAKLKGF